MKKITLENLEELSIGSSILGSGGGGGPIYDYMMARHEIEKNGPIPLIGIEDLKEDDYIAPLGTLGAPLASTEKFSSGREFPIIIEALEKRIEKKIRVVMPFEIGGGSAFTPLIAASQLGVPVLDADMMGRAFPEGQMSSFFLSGEPVLPGAITDCLDSTVLIHAVDGLALEKIGRQVAVAMGSICSFCYFVINGRQAAKCTINKSLSKAFSIGKAHIKAKKSGKDPLEAVLSICKGVFIGSGKITDIDRVISGGFLNGNVVIQNKNVKMELAFQNEFLAAKCEGQIVATTPDILVLLEQETGIPIQSEALQFGLKVNLIALPAPAMWTTPAGLALVGPRYFGYDIDYQPINKFKKSET